MDVENAMITNGQQRTKNVGKDVKPLRNVESRKVLGNIGNGDKLQNEKKTLAAAMKAKKAAEQPMRLKVVDQKQLNIPTEDETNNEENMCKVEECMDVDNDSDCGCLSEDEVLSDPGKFILSDLDIAFREPIYAKDALIKWKKAEKQYMPIPKYMKRQREIDWDMRATLVDWLVEVGEEFKLNNETLYLAVSYLDRFLSIMSCSRDKLQLAGVSSMFISSKYEEIYPPTASEFVNLTDNTYNSKQLLKLEISMLKALKFDVASPTINSFLFHFTQNYDDLLINTNPEDLLKLENLTRYISELTLLEGETFLCFYPSQIAASALYVAAATLSLTKWMENLWLKTGYSLKELEPCIRFVHKLYILSPRLSWTAIQEKYKDPRFDCVATIEAPRSIPFPVSN